MTKEHRTIKQLTQQVEELTHANESLSRDNKYNNECREKYARELEDIHGTLDLLGIPRSRRGSYQSLSVNARFTLFLAQTNGIKVSQPATEE